MTGASDYLAGMKDWLRLRTSFSQDLGSFFWLYLRFLTLDGGL